MAKQQPVALVFAGPVSRGTLGQLPGLNHHLRWIKSSSIATASRAVRALRAGIAVGEYTDLTNASAILISVPHDAVDHWAETLAGCGLDWSKRLAVLYDSERDCDALLPLQRKGALVATLDYHPRPEQFLVQASAEALRLIRVLTHDKPLIRLSCKDQYRRALHCARDEFLPLFASTVDHFRAAGMQKAAAEKAAAAAIEDSARAYLRAGHRVLGRSV